ncbi:hypothetical protein GW915_04225 [bacterium]|nr:hypothetical protein [bacterium]
MVAGLAKATGGCLMLDAEECSDGIGVYYLGALAYTGFRVWEIIDVWTIPSRHNRKYRAIKAKTESQSFQLQSLQVFPVVALEREVFKGVSLNMSFKF